MAVGAIQVFYSYTREDIVLLKELDTHLVTLRRDGLISTWHDQEIRPGSSREEEILTHLQAAQIILLLVSPDFIACEHCYEVEVQEALKKHDAGTAHVLPIILRPCVWEQTPLVKFQMIGKVITVSVETVKLVHELAQKVTVEDWVDGISATLQGE